MPQTPPNRMAEARTESIRLVRERLSGSPLRDAALRVGLAIDADGCATIDVLGRTHKVSPDSFLVKTVDNSPHPVDEFLVLRYLEAKSEVKPTGEPITFRDLPGGVFYFEPMSNRTSRIILKTFGNDIDRLRAAFERYPHTAVTQGDLGMTVHAIGRLDVTLIYRRGDEEFSASLDILYDRAIIAVYTTDEVAALTTRLAIGLSFTPQ